MPNGPACGIIQPAGNRPQQEQGEREMTRHLARLLPCRFCLLGAYAQRKPRSVIGRIWWWHAGWCPLRRMYQRLTCPPDKPAQP